MDDKKILEDGYSRSASTYDQVSGVAYPGALYGLLPFIQVDAFPRILDVGCGTGTTLFEAARLLGPCRKVVGVDIAPGMVARAREKSNWLDPTAEFIVADAEKLPFPDQHFDLALCMSVYHWFAHQREALAGFARVLAPSGQLALASLVSPAFREWTALMREIWTEIAGAGSCPWKPNIPTCAQLIADLEATGFVVEHLAYESYPVAIQDVHGFLSWLTVVAPSWLGSEPRHQSEVLEIATRRLLGALPSGFVSSRSTVSIVARKPPLRLRGPATSGLVPS